MAKKTNKVENDIDKRRFPRVSFRNDVGQAGSILGARVVWSGGEISDVYDISFKGFAVSRPGLVHLKAGAFQSVRIELGHRPGVLMPVKVAWVSEQSVGLQIGDISADAHLSLTTFLTDKLVGENMRPVDKRFFGAQQDFDYWFQGPNATSLFLWCDKNDRSKIAKVVLELDDSVWEFENRRVTKGEQFNMRAMQILGHIESTQFQLKDVIEKVATLE